nr:ATP-dependent helicase [Treponema sp.]
KDSLAYLSLCANPRDEISFRRVINKPSRGIGEKTQDLIMESAISSQTMDFSSRPIYSNLIEAVEKKAPELSKKARAGSEEFVRIFTRLLNSFNKDKNLSDFIERIINDTGLLEYHKASDEIEGTQRVQNLQELVNSAVPYECSIEGLVDFLDAINLDRTLDLENENASDDAVTLITLHNTKGLEYNKVIITGLEEGVFPRMDKTGAELEEERRLFYVGITRAKDELYVTSASKRCLYGSWQYLRPSPFLKDAAGAFTTIGNLPFGFNKKTYDGPSFGKQIPSSFSSKSTFERSSSEAFGEDLAAQKAELIEKWKKGSLVYHDDYGQGAVAKCYLNGTEVVIEVHFEGGFKKKFLPEYQGNKLQIIKD